MRLQLVAVKGYKLMFVFMSDLLGMGIRKCPFDLEMELHLSAAYLCVIMVTRLAFLLQLWAMEILLEAS